MTTIYGTIAGYKAWADDRGVSYVGQTDNQITQALVRSSEYVDGAFRSMFPGWKASGRAQVREWPRAGATDREGYGVDGTIVPPEVESATYEGAKRELVIAGSLSPDLVAGGGVKRRVKAGSVEVEYAVDGSTTTTFQAIEQALGSLLIVRAAYSGVTVRA